MGVRDPAAWVEHVQQLYRSLDAEGVAALYTDDCRTFHAGRLFTPEQVHRHPHEWFGSLEDYRIERTFRAAFGDVIVSETRASYEKSSTDPDAVGDERYQAGLRYREYGIDIYWVNQAGRIYHKHNVEIVAPDTGDEPDEAVHPGAPPV
jgi:hypothetical protein